GYAAGAVWSVDHREPPRGSCAQAGTPNVQRPRGRVRAALGVAALVRGTREGYSARLQTPLSEPGDTPAAPDPRELEQDVTLRDGSQLHIRPIRASDAPRLIETYGRLGAQSAYQRFFTVMKRLPPDWARILADVDYRRRLALIAERGPADAAEL